MRHRLKCLLLAAALVALGGCMTLPAVDRQAITTEAIPLSKSTTLGRIASSYRPAPEQSGFRLMPLGTFALDTRVQLARRAEASLDVQYYHFENDATGRWLLRGLRDAANRGVRVRLLDDDFYTDGEDELFLAFAAHRNVEVRLFNPFCCLRDHGQAKKHLHSTIGWNARMDGIQGVYVVEKPEDLKADDFVIVLNIAPSEKAYKSPALAADANVIKARFGTMKLHCAWL